MIPGARPATQHANAEAAEVPPVDAATLSAFETLYDVRGYLYDRW